MLVFLSWSLMESGGKLKIFTWQLRKFPKKNIIIQSLLRDMVTRFFENLPLPYWKHSCSRTLNLLICGFIPAKIEITYWKFEKLSHYGNIHLLDPPCTNHGDFPIHTSTNLVKLKRINQVMMDEGFTLPSQESSTTKNVDLNSIPLHDLLQKSDPSFFKITFQAT